MAGLAVPRGNMPVLAQKVGIARPIRQLLDVRAILVKSSGRTIVPEYLYIVATLVVNSTRYVETIPNIIS